MQVIYAHEQPPAALRSSIFLAGPTPRDEQTPSWRPEALRRLEARGYDGVVFVPEPRSGQFSPDYEAQVLWEEEHLHGADVVLFWIPREMRSMPALTTNDEWGTFKGLGKAVLGAPPEAQKVRYQQHHARALGVPSCSTLDDTVDEALRMIGPGAERSGGERQVPLHVWRTAAFQSWYAALKAAGRRLDGARLEWVCRAGPGRRWLFLWALRVNVHIPEEGRNKRSEVVVGRPDVAAVLMYRRAPDPLQTQVVLVREFRSAVRNEAGMVVELPSGSSPDEGRAPLAVALDEVREETGLSLDGAKLRPVASRQLAATLLSHHAQLYAVELTEEELAWLRARQGQPQGEDSSERTYVHVASVGELRRDASLDWSTLGMILGVLG